MLDRTWKKLGQLWDALDKDVEEIFTSSNGKLIIRCVNGRITIDGKFESIMVNGRLVRFKEEV